VKPAAFYPETHYFWLAPHCLYQMY